MYSPHESLPSTEVQGLGAERFSVATSREHSSHRDSVRRVIEVVTQDLSATVGNNEMAELACLSPYHFSRTFRQVTGIPPMQFVCALRVQRAKELLVHTNLSVTDICFETGYNSLGTFITRFGTLVGISPTAFRQIAGEISGMSLRDLICPIRQDRRDLNGSELQLRGYVENIAELDGIAFCGLFRRAVPEGTPISCDIVHSDGAYAMMPPTQGEWYAMALGIPWTVNAATLLTLSGLLRGRSGCIVSEGGTWRGESQIRLASPDPCHPPILPALPILVRHYSTELATSA
ncbi:helix-turn-helix domain-containing protein [Sinorhizobium medicae]|nr:helix-turn-helix domain-containing protein [Sinorhizobium medicae]